MPTNDTNYHGKLSREEHEGALRKTWATDLHGYSRTLYCPLITLINTDAFYSLFTSFPSLSILLASMPGQKDGAAILFSIILMPRGIYITPLRGCIDAPMVLN